MSDVFIRMLLGQSTSLIRHSHPYSTNVV